MIAKLVLILANQTAQIWAISFGKLVFMKSINRWFCPKSADYLNSTFYLTLAHSVPLDKTRLDRFTT